MGTFFRLSVECGQDERLAKDVARHFDGYSFDLTETQKSICSARIIKDADLASWAIGWPISICPATTQFFTTEAIVFFHRQ